MIETKVIKEFKNFTIYEKYGEYFMLFDPKFDSNEIKEKQYENIEVIPQDTANKQVYVNLRDNDLTVNLAPYIDNELETNIGIFGLLEKLSNSFLLRKSDLKKLRGDFGELLFLKFNRDAEKFFHEGSFDIIDKNKNVYEIKSFSTKKNQVTISIQQLKEKTLKYAVPVIVSTSGRNSITIMDLIEDTKNQMPAQVYNEMISRYEKSISRYLPHEITKPFEVTNQLKEQKLDSNVKGGDLIFEITYSESDYKI